MTLCAYPGCGRPAIGTEPLCDQHSGAGYRFGKLELAPIPGGWEPRFGTTDGFFLAEEVARVLAFRILGIDPPSRSPLQRAEEGRNDPAAVGASQAALAADAARTPGAKSPGTPFETPPRGGSSG